MTSLDRDLLHAAGEQRGHGRVLATVGHEVELVVGGDDQRGTGCERGQDLPRLFTGPEPAAVVDVHGDEDA